MGRGQRFEVKAPSEIDPRVRRFLGPDHYRGPDTLGRDGCLVQPGKTLRQVNSVRRNQAANQRGNQRRGAGTPSYFDFQANFGYWTGFIHLLLPTLENKLETFQFSKNWQKQMNWTFIATFILKAF